MTSYQPTCRVCFRHLKISEPIPQHLGTGTEQELLDVEDALALFGPRAADGTAIASSKGTKPTKSAPEPPSPSVPNPIRDRVDSASSNQSLYGEDLIVYANLRRLPGEPESSHDPNSPRRDRFVQAQSVGSIDGASWQPCHLSSVLLSVDGLRCFSVCYRKQRRELCFRR